MLNILILEGHLGKDPELKKDGQGNPLFCTFTMAQTIKRKIKGEEKEFPLWAEVTIWGKIAESHAKNLHKGRRVVVNGSFFIEDWKATSGAARYTVKIKATEVNYFDEPTRRGKTGDEHQDQSPAPNYYDQHEEEKPLVSGDTPTPWN